MKRKPSKKYINFYFAYSQSSKPAQGLEWLEYLSDNEDDFLSLQNTIKTQGTLSLLNNYDDYDKKPHKSTKYDGMSQTEIARIFERTPEAIRQIEEKALQKLRHPSRSKHLRSFLPL